MKAAQLAPFVGQLVILTWRDAVGSDDWQTESDARATALAKITEVGWVIAVVSDEKPRRITLGSCRDDDGNWNGVSCVPCGWVETCERLG